MSGTGAAGASYGELLVTSLLVLGAVCVGAFVVVRLVGRFVLTGRARGGHLLDVIARLPLEPRRSLYVVEVAGKTLLVGTSEMGLSVLSELDAKAVRDRMVEPPTFGELVRSALLRRGARRSEGEVAKDGGLVPPAKMPLEPIEPSLPAALEDAAARGDAHSMAGGGERVGDARRASTQGARVAHGGEAP